MARRRATRTLLALAAAVLAAGVASARPPGPPPPEAFIERHAERLGLDEETLGEIRRISDAARADEEQRRPLLHEAHEELRRLLSADSPDPEAVFEQNERIGALELEERQARLRAMLAIRALLTPEQREELVRIREERGPGPRGPGGRHGPMGPHGPPPCAEDLASLCPEVDGGRGALRCLDAHWEELSAPCRHFVEEGPFSTGRPPR